jgi:hypothetical protein
MHDLYVSFNVKDLQKAMFRKESLPAVVMNPQDANQEYIRGNVELVRIRDAEGRIAAEGALPYPPGVLCVVPGEIGVGRCSVTSWRWKRALTCCRLLTGVAGRLQRKRRRRDQAVIWVCVEVNPLLT